MRTSTITPVLLAALLLASSGNKSLADTHYVDINNATPSAPYTTWSTAANDIQSAVDQTVYDDTVLVAEGYYYLTSDIVVTNDIAIRSVNGPDATIIDGGGITRCFNLGYSFCFIDGFTITNGSAPGSDGGGIYSRIDETIVFNCVFRGNNARNGGGMSDGMAYYCTFVSNSASYGGGLHVASADTCVFIGNSASTEGGGMNYGTANNCIFINNSAGYNGGGARQIMANDCDFIGNSAGEDGGGLIGFASSIRINNCTFDGNVAGDDGGGVSLSQGIANNCTFTSNSAGGVGGGMNFGTAYNCTIIGNTASYKGGGMYKGGAYNCIIWSNTAIVSAQNIYSILPKSSCSPGSVYVTHGVDGNITNAPLFIGAGNYRLSTNSPCINAGTNAYVSVAADLDGNPRIVEGTVDMGAYESGFDGCFITNCIRSGSETILQWTAFPMWESTVCWSSNLVTMPFIDLSSALPYPSNIYTDTVHGADNKCFYRVDLK